MAEQAAGTDFTTVIGGDVVIKGEVSVERGMRVDGQIEGAVATKGKVLVGKSGQLKAEVQAGTLVIEGRITGNVKAERVQIEATGQVIGDLAAARLVVSEGATFVGKVNVSPEAAREAPKGEAAGAATGLRSAGSTASAVALSGQAVRR
jgi:cytoskeletal protein CcmA (bactofilin family)